jgi:hypothetical protein
MPLTLLLQSFLIKVRRYRNMRDVMRLSENIGGRARLLDRLTVFQ